MIISTIEHVHEERASEPGPEFDAIAVLEICNWLVCQQQSSAVMRTGLFADEMLFMERL